MLARLVLVVNLRRGGEVIGNNLDRPRDIARRHAEIAMLIRPPLHIPVIPVQDRAGAGYGNEE